MYPVLELGRNQSNEDTNKNPQTPENGDSSDKGEEMKGPDRSERMVINVSGLQSEIHYETFAKFPDTLLGSQEKRIKYYQPLQQEYFFDHHRPSFEAILYYYQSGGKLYRPDNVPRDVFLDEISFFELGDEVIYKYKKEEGLLEEESPLPTNALQRRIWLLFDCPESSIAASIIATITLLVILLSVIILCMASMPQFKHYRLVSMVNGSFVIDSVDEDTVPFIQDWSIIEIFCVLWFLVELVVRFVFCPEKITFFKSILNIIDIVAIVSHFICTVFGISGTVLPYSGILQFILVLRMFKLVRIFRIFRLTRFSKALKQLRETLKASLPDLALVWFFMFIAIMIFSSAVYYAESGSYDSHFASIPEAFYWGVVTMTQVGYGDMRPIGAWGKLIASLCSLSAILTLSMHASVITSNFNYFHQRDAGEKDKTSNSKIVTHAIA